MLNKIAQKDKLRKKNLNEEEQQLVIDLVNSGVGSLLDTGLSELAKFRAEHAATAQRIINAKAYERKFHRRAPMIKSKNKMLKKHQASKVIQSAKQAIKAQRKIESKNDIDGALYLSAKAVSMDKKSSFSWSVRYQSRYQNRQFNKARQALEIAIKNPLAHFSMYYDLAEYYLNKKRASDAERVLLLGLNRLGSNQKFYVLLIRAASLAKNELKVKEYHKACLSTGKSKLTKLWGNITSSTGIGKTPRDICDETLKQNHTQIAKNSSEKSSKNDDEKGNAFENVLEKVLSKANALTK